MNPEGLDHEPLFLALAWFNGMTATLMVGRLSRRFVAHRETPPRGAVGVDPGEVSGRSLRLPGRGGPDHRHDPGANNLGQPGPPGHDGDAHSPRSSISSNSSPSKQKSDRLLFSVKPAGT